MASARKAPVSAEPFAADTQAGGPPLASHGSRCAPRRLLHSGPSDGHAVSAEGDCRCGRPSSGQAHMGDLRRRLAPLRGVVACCDGGRGELARMPGQCVGVGLRQRTKSHAGRAWRESCPKPGRPARTATVLRACQVVRSERANTCKQSARPCFILLHRAFSPCKRIVLLPRVASISKPFPRRLCCYPCLLYHPHACHLHSPVPSDHDMLDARDAGLCFVLGLRLQRQTAATVPTSGADESFTSCALS